MHFNIRAEMVNRKNEKEFVYDCLVLVGYKILEVNMTNVDIYYI